VDGDLFGCIARTMGLGLLECCMMHYCCLVEFVNEDHPRSS
jgi:hypothetical protein